MLRLIYRIITFPYFFWKFGKWAYEANCHHYGDKGWRMIPRLRDISTIAWWDEPVKVYRRIEGDLIQVSWKSNVDPYYLLVGMGNKLFPLPWIKPLYDEWITPLKMEECDFEF